MIAIVAVISELIDGFGTALQPKYLLYCAVGVLLGTAVGVLPGIGPALTIALLLPVTYDVEATGAFIMFAGIYYGGMYGGSTTSILLNTPGEAASVVTALEGFQMAKRGRGGPALATAAIGSFVAGTIGTVIITFVGPAASRVVKLFQPADYFALMILAFTSVGALVGRSALRGMISLTLGLFVGLIGFDEINGQARYVFGESHLQGGISVVLLAVGLFAVGETLYVASHRDTGGDEIIPVRGKLWLSGDDLRRSWKPWLRGTALGFPLGMLPTGGAEVPTFLSYGLEKRLSKHRDEFGKGAIEGVAGPEAANNAAFAGVLVPLLTLALPTSATAAIMLTAFQRYGIQPGP
ncbi:MAG: tripartite tricarboxylate transporter permease, partial [Actinomycetota bacterium]|nr:tripartite tricarboxylate transporter permease [Actinomycetota bacterium]